MCCNVTVFIAVSVLLVVENITNVQVTVRKFYKSEPPRSRSKWDIVRLERVDAVTYHPSPSVRCSLQLLRVCGTHLYAHGSTIVGFYHGLTRITNGTAAGTNRAPYKLKNTAPVHVCPPVRELTDEYALQISKRRNNPITGLDRP